jgi:hypothetical protein
MIRLSASVGVDYLVMVTVRRNIVVNTDTMLLGHPWENGATMTGYRQPPRQMSMVPFYLQTQLALNPLVHGSLHRHHPLTYHWEMIYLKELDHLLNLRLVPVSASQRFRSKERTL